MSSTESSNPATAPKLDIPAEHGALLPRLARQNIAHRLETGAPLPSASNMPESLTRPGAAFTSLYHGDALRGCMGTLLAERPLIEAVMATALDAALGDPRFPAVERDELDQLTVTVAVLSDPVPLPVESEQDLLQRLQPGEDGLILHEAQYRATFLPAVWESLPDPHDFLVHLKAKAGLRPDYWSSTIQFARYRSVSFTDPPPSA